jgi:hypothetical protein
VAEEERRGRKEVIREFVDRYIDLMRDSVTVMGIPAEMLADYAPLLEKVVNKTIAFTEFIDRNPGISDEFINLVNEPRCVEIFWRKAPKRGRIPPGVLQDILHECIEAVY